MDVIKFPRKKRWKLHLGQGKNLQCIKRTDEPFLVVGQFDATRKISLLGFPVGLCVSCRKSVRRMILKRG